MEASVNHDTAKLRTALEKWRESLVNLSGRNKLLNYRPTKSSTLEFVRQSQREVLELVMNSDGIFSVGTKPPAKKTDEGGELEDEVLEGIEDFDYDRFPNHLFVDRTQLDVDRILKNLAAVGRREYLDKGLSVLYLAIGALRWTEQSGDSRRSPLLFFPVELETDGPRQPHRLKPATDDTAVNLALGLKLREYGIELPTSADVDRALDSGGLGEALGLFKRMELPEGWVIEDLASLSTFMFAKEAMFRDLEANEERILEHGLLGAIADPQFDERAAYLFEPVDEHRIDQAAPPEETPLVLDADSSQRIAVAAARDGRSFVLDGPPGTGKSQTIANIIGALMHDGKRVLFVSEKAVALDVVRDRLTDRGLGSFVLELHSHKAARSEVAAGIARALDTRISPARKASPLVKPRSSELRSNLTGYADAMNEMREPLKMSVHEAMGLLEATGAHWTAPPAAFAATTLEQSSLDAIRTAATAAARAWPILLRGRGDAWYGIADLDGLDFSVEAARNSARELVRELEEFEGREQFGLVRMTSWREADHLLRLFHERASHGVDWLSYDSLDAVAADIDRLMAAVRARDLAVSEAARLGGPEWRSVPNRLADKSIGQSLESARPDAIDSSISSTHALLETTAEARTATNALRNAADELTDVLGLARNAGPDSIESLVWVADAALANDAPSRQWVRSEDALSKARETLRLLRQAIVAEDAAKSRALEYFTPDLRDLPIAAIAERLSEARGLRKWSADARRDRKSVASVSSGSRKLALDHLDVAVEWERSRTELAREWERAREPLEPYSNAPFDEHIETALRNAEAITQRASVTDWSSLDATLSDPERRDRGRAARNELTRAATRWNELTGSVASRLSGNPLNGTFDDILSNIAIIDEDIEALIRSSAEVTAVIGKDATPREVWACSDAVGMAGIRANELEQVRDAVDPLVDRLAHDVSDEALNALNAQYQWAVAVRNAVAALTGRSSDASLDRVELAALENSLPARRLKAAGEAWEARRDDLVGRFDAEVARTLTSDLDDPDEGRELLEFFAASSDGAEAAFAAREARSALQELGVGEILAALVDSAVDDSMVAASMEYAVLRHWIDHQLRYDRRLRSRTGEERDEVVDQFRNIDHEVIDESIPEIISAANERKPNSSYGQSALVRREGEKKRRHIPVRDLMDQARDVIQAIHPCFMMSPLAVSQYLPSDIQFDVVIFDEASQVMPGDAVNCIYRGAALIAAGDQKQLPPTSFFMASTVGDEDDEEEDLASDYESVLDLMKSSGSFNAITLRWHYRSRHEHLIAFSNASFYESKLVTFPSAVDHDDHLGVKLHQVNGTYRRSGARDNPDEAKAVAARVINHFDNRPGESVGVVAFSAAQRDTIENALTLARAERPELENHFAEDRLDGLFVKSLEEVQGDERDVIILSVGYGPDENGKVYSNFGPINQKGGHRRLNVAVTRARKLVEVVSSVSASQIGETGSEGVRHFRRYLDYAERGPAALALELGPEGRDTESPFEDAVIDVIRGMGFDARPQVGVAGYRIDIGVIHPDRPGAFLLGVECDGAQYHSSRTARDRDRLRHEVLEGLGWRLHHIWGTAWYRNRDHEIDRLRKVLEEQLTSAHEGRVAARPNSRVIEVEEVASVAHLEPPEWAVPYEITRFPSFPRTDLSDEHNARYLVPFIDAVVETEGPIHTDVLALRLRDHSGIGRVGRLIRGTLNRAIQLSQIAVRDGDFVLGSDGSIDHVRSATVEATRTVAQVHSSEIELAVQYVVRDATSASRREVIEAVARAFGWSRTGSEVSLAIDRAIDTLVERGGVTESGAGLASART